MCEPREQTVNNHGREVHVGFVDARLLCTGQVTVGCQKIDGPISPWGTISPKMARILALSRRYGSKLTWVYQLTSYSQ